MPTISEVTEVIDFLKAITGISDTNTLIAVIAVIVVIAVGLIVGLIVGLSLSLVIIKARKHFNKILTDKINELQGKQPDGQQGTILEDDKVQEIIQAIDGKIAGRIADLQANREQKGEETDQRITGLQEVIKEQGKTLVELMEDTSKQKIKDFKKSTKPTHPQPD